MRQTSLWVHEARRVGTALLALPVLTGAAIAAVTMIARPATSGVVGPDLTPVRLTSYVLPVAVGLAAAAVLPRESMLEQHLTLPTPYRTTAYRRFTLLAGASLLTAVGLLVVLVSSHRWHSPAQGVAALLIPGGPAALLLGVGAWAGGRWHSAAAASSVVLAAWLGQLLLWDRVVGDWRLNKTALIVLGALAVTVALRGLEDSEKVLAATQEPR
jgi:hypothetical protein